MLILKNNYPDNNSFIKYFELKGTLFPDGKAIDVLCDNFFDIVCRFQKYCHYHYHHSHLLYAVRIKIRTNISIKTGLVNFIIYRSIKLLNISKYSFNLKK